jgi:hypothetical protein
MNNNKNNIQSNMPSNVPGNMQLIDYYNNLISIKKELEEKIYKKLSKDESFSEMLDNIKNNFVNNNISIVEDNLSKSDLTNYKGFNGKLINILEIIENKFSYTEIAVIVAIEEISKRKITEEDIIQFKEKKIINRNWKGTF